VRGAVLDLFGTLVTDTAFTFTDQHIPDRDDPSPPHSDHQSHNQNGDVF
jgi:hypothetical protein